jgi:protein-tyrosine phosphatase
MIGVWLAGCGDGRSLPVAPSAQVAVAPTPRLSSADNFRDVAGGDDQTAYRTAAGQALRRGVIYRSNALALSAADQATLGGLGIVSVFDLRTPGEIAQKPDVLPSGASYLNINIAGTPDSPIATLTSAADAVAWMENANRGFVTDAGTRGRFAELMRALAAGTGPQLYHCTGGKDRTGWATAVLLTLVGVPQSVVVQDYMLTNTYSAVTIQTSYQRMVDVYGRSFADAYLPVTVVHESYLLAGLDQAVASYGSMNGYITHGLGLDAATQARLRGRFLADVARVR